MNCLGLPILILLSQSVFSQSPTADKQIPVAPKCEIDVPVAACCPIEDEFPRPCIPFDVNDPLCSDRRSWYCCFELESGYSFPGREVFPNHGIDCRTASKYVWKTEKEWCPVPGPAIPNPFQPLEDFTRWKQQQKRASSGDGKFDCQNPSPNADQYSNLDSLLPSPKFPDLSPTLNEYGNGDDELSLNDQHEHNNMAMSNDDADPISMFLAQNEISHDDPITLNVDYDNFLDSANAIGGGGGGNSGQSMTGDDIATFTDQDMFSNAV